jgi:hypothetical protein
MVRHLSHDGRQRGQPGRRLAGDHRRHASGPPGKVAETMRERDYRWPTLADPMRRSSANTVSVASRLRRHRPSGEIRSISLGYTSEIGLRLRLWWASRIAA